MAPLDPLELLGGMFAALLTIMVLSYIFGDNVFFRLAIHLFIGATAGYAGAVAVKQVILPMLWEPLQANLLDGLTDPVILVGWILSILLLFKAFPETSRLGALPMALLIGVAAAVIVGGGITGTLIPQTRAAAGGFSREAFSPPPGLAAGDETFFFLERSAEAIVVALGTILTLLYFTYVRMPSSAATPSEGLARAWRWANVAGRGFLAITFGVLFAGTLSTAILALSERIDFLVKLTSELLTMISGGA